MRRDATFNCLERQSEEGSEKKCVCVRERERKKYPDRLRKRERE